MSKVEQQTSQNVITLRGSTEIVTEFFGFSINSILYQRGIYPPESFSRVSKYGLTMLVTEDEKLKQYLAQVLEQLSGWLMNGEVQKLVVVVVGVDSGETLERWVFDIQTEVDPLHLVSGKSSGGGKSVKKIMNEIQAIIRQITASVTFLPLLNESCTFDLLVYADKETNIPMTWEESDPKMINNSAEVKLRSFTTTVHKVDSMVAYKNPDFADDV